MKKILAEMNKRLASFDLPADLTFLARHEQINIATKSQHAKTLNVSFWLFYHKNMTPIHDIDNAFILHNGTRLLADVQSIVDILEEQVRLTDVDCAPISKSTLMYAITESISDRISSRITCEPALTVEYIQGGHFDGELRCSNQYPFLVCLAYPSGFKQHSAMILSADRMFDPNNPLRKPGAPVSKELIQIIRDSADYSSSYDVMHDLKKYAEYLHTAYDTDKRDVCVHAIPIDWAVCLYPHMDMNLDLKYFIFVGTKYHEALFLDARPISSYPGENKILLKKSERNTNSFLYARK